MIRFLDITENNFGYILQNQNEKYVLYKSRNESKASHYLKQVSPSEIYISGMFYDKSTNQFKGKTIDNKKVVVTLANGSAKLVV